MRRILTWHFPLPRTHTGIPLGNGTQGVLIWGEGQTLRLTIGRADFWDHRGGIAWTPEMSYRRIRASLEKGEQKALADLFA
ncbi:MAG: hypothetical protein N3A66_12135, partial [Planctomycetota bacterium]|nr:hypothetical protein [Planctomycetota bacterium]